MLESWLGCEEGNWGENCCDVWLVVLSGWCVVGREVGCCDGGRMVVGGVGFLEAILVGGVKERFG